MTEEYSWKAGNCFQCSQWTGTGCSLTACCRTTTYIYNNGNLVEIREDSSEN